MLHCAVCQRLRCPFLFKPIGRSSNGTDPIGAVWNVSSQSVTSSTATLTWNDPECPDRGGSLVYYDVRLYNKDTLSDMFVVTSRRPSTYVANLVPFERCGVVVRYVNSVGAGPFSDEFNFRTLPSGELR